MTTKKPSKSEKGERDEERLGNRFKVNKDRDETWEN